MTNFRLGTLAAGARTIALGVLLGSAIARGDGGLPCVSEPAGPFDVTIFVGPTPLRVGAVDVSVLLLDQTSRAPVLDAAVDVTAVQAGTMRSAVATRGAAANKLLYAAWLDIDQPGRWSITAQIHGSAGTATLTCAVEVAPPLAPLIAFWPYLVLPALAIAGFVLHQRLKQRRAHARPSPTR